MQLQNVLYFLVWAGLIFLMMRFGCGVHIMGHGRRHSTQSSDSWTPPEKSIDPVCGMTVSTQTAKSAVHAGHAYYFCSSDCRAKFEGAPMSYEQPGNPSLREGNRHGC